MRALYQIKESDGVKINIICWEERDIRDQAKAKRAETQGKPYGLPYELEVMKSD